MAKKKVKKSVKKTASKKAPPPRKSPKGGSGGSKKKPEALRALKSGTPLHRNGNPPTFLVIHSPTGGLPALDDVGLVPSTVIKNSATWELTPHKISLDRKSLLVKVTRTRDAVGSDLLDDPLDLNVTVTNTATTPPAPIGTVSISTVVTNETP
ncbi:MAG: hypothetical protein U0939_26035 [Pirellulales bacterium]